MKTIRPAILSLGLCVLLAVGCAHNQVVLRVDLYGDDPTSLVPLTASRVVALGNALDQAEAEGDRLVEERVGLAQKLYDTYAAAFAVRGTNAETFAQLARPREYLQDYTNVVHAKHGELKQTIRAARQALEQYSVTMKTPRQETVIETRTKMQEAARTKVEQAADMLLELAEPLGTDFERSLISEWPTTVRALSGERFKALATNVTPAAQSLQQQLESTYHRRPSRVAGAIRQLKVDESPGREAVFARASDLAIRPGLGRTGSDAVGMLQTYNPADTDRYQDWSDPVWRALTSPENAWKWNNAFSTNFFYAEGNSSVVVVRDSPVSFRIQKGDNNPTALVQSQLQITRSIADAAISIAGAATGMPVPKLPGGSKPNGGDTNATSAAPAEEAKTDDYSARKAAVTAREKLRTDVVRALRASLLNLREQINALDETNLAGRTNLLMQLHATLEGTGIALQPAGK